MKLLAAAILVFASASALRSGPYLPSGWRPDGPAFLLPSEPRPPVVVPPEDLILQGSEASGSDFLREYGPPKIQSLPEVATEQAFAVLQARFTEEEKEVNAELDSATEVIDLKYVAEDTDSATEAAIEAQIIEEPSPILIQNLPEQPAAEARSLNLEVVETASQDLKTAQETKSLNLGEVNVSTGLEATQQTVEIQETSGELAAVQELGETLAEVKAVEEDVKNIEDVIVSLEKEAVAEQVQLSQDLTKSVQLTSGSVEQVPEGFLEYGPPGFREYGPPNLIPRTADDVKSEDEKIESNETRRRRFSPKFKSIKSKKH